MGNNMKIITLNCNGIRSAAKKGFYEWMKKQRADVICLQETTMLKSPDTAALVSTAN